jgi:hypothetical protein
VLYNKIVLTGGLFYVPKHRSKIVVHAMQFTEC